MNVESRAWVDALAFVCSLILDEEEIVWASQAMAGRALFVDMGTFARLFPVLRDLLRLVVDDAPFGIARSLEAFITVYVEFRKPPVGVVLGEGRQQFLVFRSVAFAPTFDSARVVGDRQCRRRALPA